MWLIYGVPALAAIFLGIVLWRHRDPPAFGYVSFAILVGCIYIFILIDTKRINDLPWGPVGDLIDRVKNAEKRIDHLEQVFDFETQSFTLRDLREQSGLKVEPIPDGKPFKFQTTFYLNHHAVPGSVTVWENDTPMAPPRFDVVGATVLVKSVLDPRTPTREGDEFDEPPYVIRYFKSEDAPEHAR